MRATWPLRLKMAPPMPFPAPAAVGGVVPGRGGVEGARWALGLKGGPPIPFPGAGGGGPAARRAGPAEGAVQGKGGLGKNDDAAEVEDGPAEPRAPAAAEAVGG